MVNDQKELIVGGRQKNQSYKAEASGIAVLQSPLFFIDYKGIVRKDMKKYTKEEAINIVVECAKAYKNELAGRSLLFIGIDKQKKTSFVELSFYGNNFMHLTGLKAPRRDKANRPFANAFYKKSLNHKLSPTDFDFSDDGTTHMKLEVLPGIINKYLQAHMIGDYDTTKPRLVTEKLAGSTSACMGFIFDQKLKQYVPNTVVKEDIRDITRRYSTVIAVYRKAIDDLQYTEMTFKSKKVDFSVIDFPDEFKYLNPRIS